MTWRVSLRRVARADVRGARDWYERKRAGLGEDFLLAVADAVARLEDAAEQPPIYYEGFRRVMTRRFPYNIFYRVEGDEAIVFRVLHATRDHTRHLP